ncbi:energy-coupled thiamine transporter ThiT [Heyndrickxia camelliae]|uniref:Energy-coupled thiamine transporter ThiT n=1 Tax=Heyndrickxia camelliae TaxID=1707093 RepID=A0A2N3LPU9_9BACI|nr:energy-coupled thiamine transporter ThiT [Heyndrickxia camelliae]PKR86651.1 energy-coupled thiamine transporter ThiT [Heyndrickxia camelliae]
MKTKTLFLVEVAVLGALAYLLDLVSGIICQAIWPEGGSVTLAMIPVFIMAFRWGVKGGLLTGFILGLLQFITGFAKIYTLTQGILDYFVAFTVIGFAGLFANKIRNALESSKKGTWITYSIIGILIGSLLRYIVHFYTGIVFFGTYAPAGQPVVLYSFLYNGGYMLPSFILSVILVLFILIISPRLVMRKK